MAQPKDEALAPLPCSPLQTYEARIAAGELREDPAQRALAQCFQTFFERLQVVLDAPRPNLLRRLFGAPVHDEHAMALYVYGEVGRGKTMLMDMFYQCLPNTWHKRRIHFHAFMRDIHSRMHAWRQLHEGEQDLLPRIVEDYAEDIHILCLDEFQVTDVTDAMILSRLFTLLLEDGVAVIITSNRHPRDLYQGGLQRDQFLKFVDLVEKRMEIVSLDSPTDYRMQQIAALESTYVYPLGEAADDFLLQSWSTITNYAQSDPITIDVNGRKLEIEKHHSGVAWFTFEELCVRPLGAHDYIELARVCHTLFLQSIPQMRAEDRNEAKRFVTLIDVLYEHKVKLIATAAVEAEALYPKGDGTFEFQRTVSRLHEMQSAGYLALAHIG